MRSLNITNIYLFLQGGVSGKNNSAEVEIIRYQVLIPVTEVQVRASSMKDMDSHFLWELIHLKNQLQRRSEKVYHLSNRCDCLPVSLALDIYIYLFLRLAFLLYNISSFLNCTHLECL